MRAWPQTDDQSLLEAPKRLFQHNIGTNLQSKQLCTLFSLFHRRPDY